MPSSLSRRRESSHRRVEPGPLRLVAADGAVLAAELFMPLSPPVGVVLLAPAMATPRRVYAPFARSLTEGGLAVLTLDYRGIGDSAPRSRAELRRSATRLIDWADHDLPAAIQFLGERFPGLPRLYVGHSIAGPLLGLLADAPFDAALIVGAQTHTWRNWDGALRLALGAFWFAVLPAMVAVLGYLPMKRFKMGVDLPPAVAREWGRWGRGRDAIARLAASRGGAAFARLAAPVRLYAISDDGFAPRRGVEALAKLFASSEVEVRCVEPRDVDRISLGHFGFFRPAVADSLWIEARTWLLKVAAIS